MDQIDAFAQQAGESISGVLSHLWFLDVGPLQQLMSPLYEQVEDLSEVAGLPVDQLNFLMLFIISYPLSIIHRNIYNTSIRHFYSMIFGVLMVIYMMGNDFYHSLFSATVVYLILVFVRNPFGTKLIWIWAYGYMTLSHVYRIYIDYMGWKVDFTIVQMVFTLKFCALACNLQDGAFPQGEPSSLHKKLSISAPPSPLEYFSYLYYWCTILPGPYFDFVAYRSFIDRSMFAKYGGAIPGGSYKAFFMIILKLIPCFAGIILSFRFPISFIWTASREEVLGTGFFQLWAYMIYAFFMMRCQYYVGWLMSESSVVLSGFGYNGEDKEGNTMWNRLTNVEILDIELGTSVKSMIAKWNQGTAYFLKVYVYFRVTKPRGVDPKIAKGLSAASGQSVVFVLSALWHGCYPGYYYFFGVMFFVNQLNGWAAAKITPMVPDSPVARNVYSALGWLLSISSLDISALSFKALSHENSLIANQNTLWLGPIIIFAVFIFSKIFPAKRVSKTKKTQ